MNENETGCYVVGPVQVVRRYFLDIKSKQLSRLRSDTAQDLRPPPALRMHLATHPTTATTNLLLYYYASRETPLHQILIFAVHKNHSIQLETNDLFTSMLHDEKRKHSPICLSLQIPNNIKNCHSQVRTQNTDLFTS